MRNVLAAVRAGAGGVAWFVRGVLGEDGYEKYVAHHASTHNGEPAMTEREFWRDQTRRQEQNPQGRCC